MFLADIFVISFPLKCKTKKTFKIFYKKRLKIMAMKPLVSNKTKRQKEKAVIIIEADGKEIIGKP